MGKDFYEKFDSGPAEETSEEGEKPELEREALPWGKKQLEEDAELLGRFEKEAQLGAPSKEIVRVQLRQEEDEDKMAVAQKWFENHEDEIKDRGYDTKINNPGYVYRIFAEMGGFESKSVKEDPGCRQIINAMEGINILKTCLDKPQASLQDQFLVLNFLEGRAGQIAEELSQLEGKGNEAAIAGKKAELEKLFKTRKELAEKISGQDLRKEAEETLETSMPSREEFFDERLIEREVDITLKELKEDALEKAAGEMKKDIEDLTPEEQQKILSKEFQEDLGLKQKNIVRYFAWPPFKREAVFLNENNQEIKRCRFNEADGYLNGKMGEKVAKEYNLQREKIYKEKGEEYEKKIRTSVEAKISDLAASPERAIEGLSGVYARRKEELVTEHIREGLKRQKTPEELKAIEREFGARGRDLREFIDDAVYLKNEHLQGLGGKWEDDKDEIGKYLSEWGVSLTPSELEAARKAIESRTRRGYEKVVNNKPRGFFQWLLDLIIEVSKPASEKKKEKK